MAILARGTLLRKSGLDGRWTLRSQNGGFSFMKRLRSKTAIALVPTALAAIAMAGCTVYPTATVINGGGTFQTKSLSQSGQIALSYQVTNSRTGAGLMSGSYYDPSGATVDGVPNIPVKLSFVNASSDFCYATSGTSCTRTVQEICSSVPASFYAYCIEYNANNDCAHTEFTYQADGSVLPSEGLAGLLAPTTGTGSLNVCGNPQGSSQGPPGTFEMQLYSGPYAGYQWGRQLSSGGFTAGGGVSTTPPPSSGPSGSLLNLLH
jgi:hypothetical protein